MKEGITVPSVNFRVRVQNEEGEYGWADMHTDDIFKGKKVAVFSLPGAFTPTCSEYQLPAYEAAHQEITKYVDDVYCISVNDSFVMNAWRDYLDIEKIKLIPDGAGNFTRAMGMLVNKPKQNFGMRSWRYSMIVDDGVVTHFNEEPGRNDFSDDSDPYEVSDPDTMLKQLGAKTFMQDTTSNN